MSKMSKRKATGERVVKAKNDKPLPPAGPVKRSELVAFAQQVQDALGGFEEVYNTNQQHVLWSFSLMDRWMWVQRRVMQDMADSTLIRDASGSIDWLWYNNQCSQVEQICMLLKVFKQWAPEEAPVPIVSTTDDFTFGGDYGGSTISLG